jgi:formate-dependent nitrite reductase cytochrome c552 subunit
MSERKSERNQPERTNENSNIHASRRSLLFGSISLAVIALVVFWSGWPETSGGQANASGGDILIATSVCDAHALRAQQEEDPHLEIEIPAEFEKQWPSASACQSAVDAWDPETPGPIQPIPFSHKHHAGEFGIECLYCHSGTDKSQAAGVPSVEVCMGCHSQFPAEYDEIEGIRILKEHWEQKKPVEWVQIHRLPEYVQFRHNRHVKAGVACQTCHGPVEDLDKLELVPDSHIGYLVPVAKLEMGWCINCHRQNNQQASQDCLTCHY